MTFVALIGGLMVGYLVGWQARRQWFINRETQDAFDRKDRNKLAMYGIDPSVLDEASAMSNPAYTQDEYMRRVRIGRGRRIAWVRWHKRWPITSVGG